MMSFVNQPPESMISFSDLYNMMSSFRIHGRFGGGVVVLQVSMSMILIHHCCGVHGWAVRCLW